MNDTDGVNNPASNTPSDAERERMKRDHRIGWHPNGGWCRKFPGDANRTYFGKVPAPQAVEMAAVESDRRKNKLAVAVRAMNLSVREGVNLFLTHVDREHAAGKIGAARRGHYGRDLDIFIKFIGRNRKLADFCKMDAPDELFRPLRENVAKRGMHAVEKHITIVRTFLDWCSTKRRYIPAPFYADEFDRPGKKEKTAARKTERREKGQASWTAAEIREIVDAAKRSDIHRHAHVLLMLNGGMGSTDLSELLDDEIDWIRRCIHTDRSKTLVPRVVPLWSITIVAMKTSRAARAAPGKQEWSNRFFLTPKGLPLVHKMLADGGQKVAGTDSVKNWFFTLLNGDDRTRWKSPAIRLKHLKRHRAGAYTLRAFFASTAIGHGQDKDLRAIIMGHKFDNPILEYYIRDDQRAKLVAVVNHVFHQIWPDSPSSDAAQ